jgi:Uma2 family endonuclease
MSTKTKRAKRAPALLHDIDWYTYTRLLHAFAHRRGFRLTYDRGTLEIMSPRWDLERPSYILGRCIDLLTEELDLPCEAGGSVTLRRKRKGRGLEPDICYWIANAHRLLGKTRLDLRIDPPPDLAIEVDVTHTAMDRMSIYAALGVPEVWRLSPMGLEFRVLEKDGYKVHPQSLSFPRLKSADLERFLAQGKETEPAALIKQFRDWVRKTLLS